jgi:hypothetical protein
LPRWLNPETQPQPEGEMGFLKIVSLNLIRVCAVTSNTLYRPTFGIAYSRYRMEYLDGPKRHDDTHASCVCRLVSYNTLL